MHKYNQTNVWTIAFAQIAYYEEYASSFNFRSYVRFRHQIEELRMASDYDETGRWTLRYRKLDRAGCSDEFGEQTFDAVQVKLTFFRTTISTKNLYHFRFASVTTMCAMSQCSADRRSSRGKWCTRIRWSTPEALREKQWSSSAWATQV